MNSTPQLGYLLHHLSSALDRQSDQVLQERLGIGFSQFKIMTAVAETPSVQQRQIAETLGQTEASISRQVKLMQTKGLLRSVVDPKNRRRRITSLTAKGERQRQQALTVLNQYHLPIFSRLSPNQQAELLEMLSLMHREVCQGDRPGRCQQA